MNKIETLLLPCEIVVIDEVRHLAGIVIPTLDYELTELKQGDQLAVWLAAKGRNTKAVIQIDYRYPGWPRIPRCDDVLQLWEIKLRIDGKEYPLDPDDTDIWQIEAAIEERDVA